MKAQNPVLEELHAARRKILADWNADTKEYLRDALARLEQSGRGIWLGKKRTMHCTEVADRVVPEVNVDWRPGQRRRSAIETRVNYNDVR